MTISLDKLQDLFRLREEYSSKLGATERQIRSLVEGPDAQDSGPAAKTPRKQRVKTENPNDSQKVPAIETDGSEGDVPTSAMPVDTSVLPSAIGRVILSQMNPGTTYSGSELFQLTLDASGNGTDADALRSDVKDCIRTMVQSGHLIKTGEAKGSRYTLA